MRAGTIQVEKFHCRCKYAENWKRKQMHVFDTKYLIVMQKQKNPIQRKLHHTRDYLMYYGDNLQ